jgi:DNA polymerase III delta prime subunit
LVGQANAVRFLESWLAGGQFPPLLFSGPAGVGKRTAALLLAQAANCTAEDGGPESRGEGESGNGKVRTSEFPLSTSPLSTPTIVSRPSSTPCGVCRTCRSIAELSYPDLKLLLPIRLPKKSVDIENVAEATLDRYPELALGQARPVTDTKLKIPIDAVRWLRIEMGRPPLQARRRFFVLIDAHQMNAEAANALLKVLEEPQAQSTFILTSSRPSALPATIRSRCQAVRFATVAPDVIGPWLIENAGASSDDAEFTASLSGGSIGTALRFIEDREEFLVPPIVDYFAGRLGGDERAVLAALDATKEVPPAEVAGTLLFLYQETLRVKLGGASVYAKRNPGVIETNVGREADYLRRALKFLLSRSHEAGTNVNARLFNYSLLTTLKPPARTRLSA